MNPPKLARVIDISRLKSACSNCSLREMCLPTGLNQDEIEKLDQMVYTRKRVKRGDSVYRSERNSGLSTPYAAASQDHPGHGRRPRPGDRVSHGRRHARMDGIGSDQHSCNAVAWEDSEVCVIPYGRLEELSREMYVLQQHFHKVMSREIVREHGVMLLLGSMRAESASPHFCSTCRSASPRAAIPRRNSICA